VGFQKSEFQTGIAAIRKRLGRGVFAAVIIGRAREDVTRFGRGTAGAI
jgi:hypothetical protein